MPRKQAPEQSSAGIGDLVEREARPGEFGEDRQHAGPGRGFEDESAEVNAAASAATKPSAIGVENCWSARISGPAGLRRQPFGEPRHISSIAAEEPARARIAAPNLRRNMTWAASSAS